MSSKLSEGKSLGKLIDELYSIDKDIDVIEAGLREAKKRRRVKEDALLKSFDKKDINGATAKTCKAFIKRRRFPSIKDKGKFMKYVIKNKAYDLFQNRVNQKAYFDRLEEGDMVPGIDVFEKISVSLRKRETA